MVKIVFSAAHTSFTSTATKVDQIYREISAKLNIPSTQFYLLSNGKKVGQSVGQDEEIQMIFRTLGGKGGFGSMLRAIGAQIEKTTNKEACRDLSGRRLRDINEEKRLKAWMDKQKAQEPEDQEEKFQKKIGKLLAVPKKELNDPTYEASRSDLLSNISDSVEQGFKKSREAATVLSSVGLKRKLNDNGKNATVKKPKGALWIDDGLSSSSETDSDVSDAEEGESSSSACSSSKC